jgi:hypothetical protein
MGSTFFSLHYHIVFSTEERRPLIRAERRSELHSYLGGIIRGMNTFVQVWMVLAPLRGAGRFLKYRWSSRTATTGYSLAPLRGAANN